MFRRSVRNRIQGLKFGAGIVVSYFLDSTAYSGIGSLVEQLGAKL